MFTITPNTIASWYIRDQSASLTSISINLKGLNLEDPKNAAIEAVEKLLEEMFLLPPLYGGGMIIPILNAATIAAFKQYQKNGKFSVADAFLLSKKHLQRYWKTERIISEVLKELQITQIAFQMIQSEADLFLDKFYDFAGEEEEY